MLIAIVCDIVYLVVLAFAWLFILLNKAKNCFNSPSIA